jgi:hypothetical protein
VGPCPTFIPPNFLSRREKLPKCDYPVQVQVRRDKSKAMIQFNLILI